MVPDKSKPYIVLAPAWRCTYGGEVWLGRKGSRVGERFPKTCVTHNVYFWRRSNKHVGSEPNATLVDAKKPYIVLTLMNRCLSCDRLWIPKMNKPVGTLTPQCPNGHRHWWEKQ